MAYALAPSLVRWRAEFNARWPQRDKTSDGWIGDKAHQDRPSDHNPGARGLVHAFDSDEDLDGNRADAGAELASIAEWLRTRRDPRIKYVIYEGRIFASYRTSHRPAWTWGPYGGVNAHRKHLHLSILSTPEAEQDTRPWLPDAQSVAPVEKPVHQEDDDMFLLPLKGTPAHALVGPGYFQNLSQTEIDDWKAVGVPVRPAVDRARWDRLRRSCAEGDQTDISRAQTLRLIDIQRSTDDDVGT